jgi:hypothetical protein
MFQAPVVALTAEARVAVFLFERAGRTRPVIPVPFAAIDPDRPVTCDEQKINLIMQK